MGLTRSNWPKDWGLQGFELTRSFVGKRGVTPDTAFRLSKFFGTTVDFWMGLQADVDMWDTLSIHGSEYERIKPIAHAANE